MIAMHDAARPQASIDTAQLAAVVGLLMRGLEHGSREWSLARRKASVSRVLALREQVAPPQMIELLRRLAASWDDGVADSTHDLVEIGARTTATPSMTSLQAGPELAPRAAGEAAEGDGGSVAASGDVAAFPDATQGPQRVLLELMHALRAALPGDDARACVLSEELDAIESGLRSTEPLQCDDRALALSARLARWLQHRHHLHEQTVRLCRELAGSLVDVAEEASWARGQAELIERQLAGPFSARGLKAAGNLLHETRQRQGEVRSERAKAREAMNAMIQRVLAEVGELGAQTGRFSDDAGRYAQAIEQADSLEVLADTVREMVEGTRAVKDRVDQTQARMNDEHARASELSARVGELEAELQRLSNEVSTDPLTGVANRRGLTRAFEVECARAQRSGLPLAVALLDIDNFKRLNDTLGHAAGDQALVSLAQRVQQALRPTDHVARYGGEEFVVLLPGAGEPEAQQVLARLQRELTAGLFIHDDKAVLVTFSAGLTLRREDDSLDSCLERADEALYEAKHTGKNRTCVA